MIDFWRGAQSKGTSLYIDFVCLLLRIVLSIISGVNSYNIRSIVLCQYLVNYMKFHFTVFLLIYCIYRQNIIINMRKASRSHQAAFIHLRKGLCFT